MSQRCNPTVHAVMPHTWSPLSNVAPVNSSSSANAMVLLVSTYTRSFASPRAPTLVTLVLPPRWLDSIHNTNEVSRVCYNSWFGGFACPHDASNRPTPCASDASRAYTPPTPPPRAPCCRNSAATSSPASSAAPCAAVALANASMSPKYVSMLWYDGTALPCTARCAITTGSEHDKSIILTTAAACCSPPKLLPPCARHTLHASPTNAMLHVTMDDNVSTTMRAQHTWPSPCWPAALRSC